MDAMIAAGSNQVCGKRWWLPSQSGGVAVVLQPQSRTSSLFAAVWNTGRNGDPACEPSHRGCLCDFPHAHQR